MLIMINKMLGLAREQARHRMTLAAVDELGSGRLGALGARLPAPRAEVAARRWINCVGELAGEHDPLPLAFPRRVGDG